MSRSSLPQINIDSKKSSGSKTGANAKPSKRSKTPPKESASKKRDRRSRERSEEEEEREEKKGAFSRLMERSSSWMTSLILHMAIIIALALLYLPSPEVINTLIAGVQGEEVDDELIDVPEIDFDDVPEEIPEEVDFQPPTDVIEEVVSESPFDDEMAAALNVEVAEFGLDAAPESVLTDAVGFDGDGFKGRGHASRSAMLSRNGGTAESEEAVKLALAWLAAHQNPNGTWHLDHRGGGTCNGQCGDPGDIQDSFRSATGLALLPYLGYGQTRFKGEYKNVVGKGLNALVQMGQQPDRGVGVSWTDGGNMYSHGIASIALCEAYGMTQDSQLEAPAQASLDYIVSAQNPSDGGWRYSFQQAGDTSVVGWQVTALKSGYLSGLRVPTNTVSGASKFLDLVQNDEYGGAYAYSTDNKQNYRASTSAVGLLCRMYLGWKREHQGISDGAAKLAKRGPSASDYYYNYYAAQVLMQYTDGKGPMWREWNEKLRDSLIAAQEKEGHEKGSWYVRGTHGSQKGGRLYMTAMACMTLEVYYRMMPIYDVDAVEKEFPE